MEEIKKSTIEELTSFISSVVIFTISKLPNNLNIDSLQQKEVKEEITKQITKQLLYEYIKGE